MNEPTKWLVTLLLALIVAATGCHPTQPFYLHEDGDLSHYLQTATDLETPDVEQITLAEVTQSRPPLTISNAEFSSFRDVTLEECVSIAMQNSKVIRSLGATTQFGLADGLVGRTASSMTVYDPAIFESDPQAGVEAALSEFDAQFASSVFWDKQDRPQNFDGLAGSVIYSNFFRQDQGVYDASVTKRTTPGTTFAVRNQTIYTGNNNPSRGLPSDWFTAFEIEAAQPLLRNRGTQVNRAPVVLARIRTDITLADFEAAVRNMVMDVENAYWDLHAAYRLLETARIGRDQAHHVWRMALERFEANIVDKKPEAQAREQYFFFRAALERSLRDLFAAETKLRWLMGLAATDGELIRPIDRPCMARVEFEWGSALSEAMVRSAELRRQRWVVKQRELEMIVARNQLLPELDLVATYRWLGMGDELVVSDRRGLNFINTDPNDADLPINPGGTNPVGTPSPGSVAFDELTEGRFQEFRVGVQFKPPRIGARREMAGVRNSQLSLMREKARLEDMELNVSHLLTTAIQDLDSNFHVAQTHFNRWVAADEEIAMRQVDLDLAKSAEQFMNAADTLLNAHRRRADSQAEFYRNISEYNKQIAHVHFRKGSLLEYNNIQLAEGPWPKKAYWDALGQARKRDASYFLDYGWTRPRVVSQGPVDQGAGMDMGTPGPVPAGMEPATLDAEQVPTPAAKPDVLPDEEMLDQSPTSALPSSTILEEPSLSLKDDAPEQLLREPSPEAYSWGQLGLGLKQVSHEQPVTTGAGQRPPARATNR